MRASHRAAAVAFAVAGGGCGLVAGLGSDYSGPPDAAPGVDATVKSDAPSGPVESFDAAVPPDVFFADAYDEPPPPLDAACVPPASCQASTCCAPAVCSGANTCVATCKSFQQRYCGSDLDCCAGLRCDENDFCNHTCGQKDDDCEPFVIDKTCCVGLKCVNSGSESWKCQTCKPDRAPCQGDQECCSKNCNGNRC